MEWEILRNTREGQGLTYQELARRGGCVTGTTIAAWENDVPRQIAALSSLCRALGVTPSYLLGFESEPGAVRDAGEGDGYVRLGAERTEGGAPVAPSLDGPALDVVSAALDVLLDRRCAEAAEAYSSKEIGAGREIADDIDRIRAVRERIEDMRWAK